MKSPASWVCCGYLEPRREPGTGHRLLLRTESPALPTQLWWLQIACYPAKKNVTSFLGCGKVWEATCISSCAPVQSLRCLEMRCHCSELGTRQPGDTVKGS